MVPVLVLILAMCCSARKTAAQLICLPNYRCSASGQVPKVVAIRKTLTGVSPSFRHSMQCTYAVRMNAL
jgi:hypothetical protein